MRKINSAIARVRNSAGEFEALPALRGLDSYHLAVQNGFDGTEEEWMNSIIGDGWIGAFQELEAKHNTLDEKVTNQANALEAHDEILENHENVMEQRAPQNFTFTIPSSGWASISTGAYQEVTVSGILASDYPFVDVNFDTLPEESIPDMLEAWGLIIKATAKENVMYFLASEAPSLDIPVKMVVIRK